MFERFNRLPCFILIFLDEPSQSEISDLANIILSNQNVPGGQITMDVVLRLEVGHPSGDLCSHVDQLRQLERASLTLRRERLIF